MFFTLQAGMDPHDLKRPDEVIIHVRRVQLTNVMLVKFGSFLYPPNATQAWLQYEMPALAPALSSLQTYRGAAEDVLGAIAEGIEKLTKRGI